MYRLLTQGFPTPSCSLLKPGGKFLYLTWLCPPLRMHFLERPGEWDLTVSVVNNEHGSGGLDYYLYVGTKKTAN